MKHLILSTLFISVSFMAHSQVVKLSGPRIGVTVVTPGSSSDFIQNCLMPGDEGWGESTPSVVTQYGWQLETRFADGENVVGLVEWVFLVGGMEKGLFLPSVSSLFGLRSENGLEAAIGPNVSLSGFGMVLAGGFTIKGDNINIPVNLSFVPSKNKTYETNSWDPVTGIPSTSKIDYKTGARVSITIGFNLVKS